MFLMYVEMTKRNKIFTILLLLFLWFNIIISSINIVTIFTKALTRVDCSVKNSRILITSAQIVVSDQREDMFSRFNFYNSRLTG